MIWPIFPTVEASSRAVESPKNNATPKNSINNISLTIINPLKIIAILYHI